MKDTNGKNRGEIGGKEAWGRGFKTPVLIKQCNKTKQFFKIKKEIKSIEAMVYFGIK